MKNKRRVAVGLIVLVAAVFVVVAPMISLELALIAIALLQIAVLVLLVACSRDARATLRGLAHRYLSPGSAPSARGLLASVSGKGSRVEITARTSDATQDDAAARLRRKRKRAQDVQRIRASLIFDLDWYQAQSGAEFDSLDQAIADYLVRGRRAGYSPHPLFQPHWLLPTRWSKAGDDPLIAYLRNDEGLWEQSTSPLFDPRLVDERLPADEFGPLAAFLRNRDAVAPLPYDVDPAYLRPGLTLADVRPFLLIQTVQWRSREEQIAPTRATAEAPGDSPELSEAREAFAERTDAAPLVSVILPTWNRAAQLRTAIDSVARQSYSEWELIVADDGSTDDTGLVLEAASSRDARIVPIALPHRGVSAARNSALARARGDYVAFLDSDKEWEPDFLLSMVAYLEAHSYDAGYSIVEVSLKGKPLYRTVPATRESLKVANSIDQTAIVARRSLVERAGGFDESLLRAVDYDLVLALNELTELVQVPFVGVRYSEDDQDPNRISEAQSVAWNFFVRDRRRWADADLHDIEPGVVTVVIDGVRTAHEMHSALKGAREHVGDLRAELIVLPESNSWPSLQAIALAEFSAMDVRVMALPGSVDRSPLRINHAIRAARGEYIYLTSSRHLHDRGSMVDLIDALNAAAAAAVHPLVLDSNGLVADAGVVYPAGTDPVGLLGGLPPDWADWSSSIVEVPGATFPLLVRGTTVRAVRGLNTKLRQLWVDVDASQRIAVHDSKPVVLKTDNWVRLRETSAFAPRDGAEQDVRMFASLWPEPPGGTEAALAAAGVAVSVDGFRSLSTPLRPAAWTRPVWRPVHRETKPVVDRADIPLQWSIKTAAPADGRAVSWGDFHFAHSLAAALRTLGERASVDYSTNAERATAGADDVVVNLRGLKNFPVPAGATSLIWVISHPDKVSAHELAAYDLRYAASSSWPALMGEQWGVEIKTLLQCTDPERFYIDDEPVKEVEGKLVMVGNSRRQYRPAAYETANAGLPVAIYGNGWEDFVGAEYIAGAYVPNEDLRRYYRTALWALNDHWTDMRDNGFVSNRIFDVLASGGRLLTDDVVGLEGLFPDDVLPSGPATFGSPVDLLAIVQSGPAKYYTDASLRAVSEYVRTAHSFEARARVMLEDVRRLRSARGQS